jgi:hypothetical protein
MPYYIALIHKADEAIQLFPGVGFSRKRLDRVVACAPRDDERGWLLAMTRETMTSEVSLRAMTNETMTREASLRATTDEVGLHGSVALRSCSARPSSTQKKAKRGETIPPRNNIALS